MIIARSPLRITLGGGGTQSKSYIYIDDILDALRIVEKKALVGYGYYKVATSDYITVTEIADGSNTLCK